MTHFFLRLTPDMFRIIQKKDLNNIEITSFTSIFSILLKLLIMADFILTKRTPKIKGGYIG